MSIKSFKRYEKKFILTKYQYDKLTKRLLEYMEPDKFCKGGKNYSIYNIYYDTDGNDVIRHSISKPYYKEKLRLRSYYTPTSKDDLVFLELKKKIGGIVNKRRVELTLEEATKFVEYGQKPVGKDYLSQQVIEEISYYLKKHPVKKSIYIGYSRRAFFAKDDKEFRLTFDKQILTRRNDLFLESGCYGNDILEEETYLMEVKILGAMPLWFTNILSELGIYNTHFSKYGQEFMSYCKNSYCMHTDKGRGEAKIC
jgi:hypothetical protein